MIIEVLEMLFSNLYFIFYFVTITGFSKVRIHRRSDNNDCAHFRCQMVAVVKNLPSDAGNARDMGSVPGLGRSQEKGMATHPIILAEEFQGEKSLVGYSTWDHKELEMTEWLSL